MVSSSVLIAALGALPLAFAYYPAPNATSTYVSAPSGTGSASAEQTVTVGKDNTLLFSPETIHAPVGSDIKFVFFAKNHSIVSSTFDAPCVPEENAIFAGFNFAVPTGQANKTFTITVKDDKPIWLYCPQNAGAAGPHCPAGMVAVINPVEGSPNDLAAFKLKAKGFAGNATVPNTPPSGGDVENATPSGKPSSTSTGGPAESTGAAASLFATSGAVGGIVAVALGLML